MNKKEEIRKKRKEEKEKYQKDTNFSQKYICAFFV